MSQNEIIEKALEDMETAAAMRAEADRLDFVAKQQLRGLYSSAGPKGKRMKPEIKAAIADALTKREKNLYRK